MIESDESLSHKAERVYAEKQWSDSATTNTTRKFLISTSQAPIDDARPIYDNVEKTSHRLQYPSDRRPTTPSCVARRDGRRHGHLWRDGVTYYNWPCDHPWRMWTSHNRTNNRVCMHISDTMCHRIWWWCIKHHDYYHDYFTSFGQQEPNICTPGSVLSVKEEEM